MSQRIQSMAADKELAASLRAIARGNEAAAAAATAGAGGEGDASTTTSTKASPQVLECVWHACVPVQGCSWRLASGHQQRVTADVLWRVLRGTRSSRAQVHGAAVASSPPPGVAPRVPCGALRAGVK